MKHLWKIVAIHYKYESWSTISRHLPGFLRSIIYTVFKTKQKTNSNMLILSTINPVCMLFI